MSPRLFGYLAVLLTIIFCQSAFAVQCGTVPTDTRFRAVCGLQNRDLPTDENWRVEGSGVFVKWTDPVLGLRYGIVSVRHFIDQNGGYGACVQTNEWYAYFYLPDCTSYPPNGSCLPACAGINEDMFRVRITCFTLPVQEFSEERG